MGFCFACAAQFKTPGGYWWRNSVCWRCMNLLVKCVKGCFSGCGWLLRKLPKRRLYLGLPADTSYTPEMAVEADKEDLRKNRKIRQPGVFHDAADMAVAADGLHHGDAPVRRLAGRSNLMVVLSLCACVAVVLYGAYCFGILLESAKRMARATWTPRWTTNISPARSRALPVT